MGVKMGAGIVITNFTTQRERGLGLSDDDMPGRLPSPEEWPESYVYSSLFYIVVESDIEQVGAIKVGQIICR